MFPLSSAAEELLHHPAVRRVALSMMQPRPAMKRGEQVGPHLPACRLRKQHQLYLKAESAAVDCRCKRMVRPGRTRGDNAADAPLKAVGKKELELADLVAAVGLCAEIVTLDIQPPAAEPPLKAGKLLNRRGQRCQAAIGQAALKARECAEKRDHIFSISLEAPAGNISLNPDTGHVTPYLIRGPSTPLDSGYPLRACRNDKRCDCVVQETLKAF
jgi:hypothetical protein